MQIKFVLTIFIFALPVCSFAAVGHGKAREFIVNGKTREAVAAYAQLIKAQPGNPEYMMEYAYALALAGIAESALFYLDRAVRAGAGNDIYFYTAQLFSLTGQKSLAENFWNEHSAIKPPGWLKNSYQLLQLNYARDFQTDYTVDLDSLFDRANQLATNKSYLQSLYLLQEIKAQAKTNLFLPYVTASIVWEKLKCYETASKELTTGIALMQEEVAATGAVDLKEALPSFTNRLKTLEAKVQPAQNPELTLVTQQASAPQMMLYAGGMFSSSVISFNSRFGILLSNSQNMSVDFGISKAGGNTHVTLGGMSYARYKALVGGWGINGQFGETSTWNLRTSFGLSILNKAKTRSIDLFLSYDLPLQEGVTGTINLSVGQSFYFGKRRK